MFGVNSLCDICEAFDLERSVLRPEGIQKTYLTLGGVHRICQKAHACVLCKFISEVSLSSEKDQYECILSSQRRVKEVIAAQNELVDQERIYHNEILLEFRHINGRYERSITLEPCPPIVPTCLETISEDSSGKKIPWMSPRLMEPIVPLPLLKHWIRGCKDMHGEACASPPWASRIEWPTTLRLIDVSRNCIISVRIPSIHKTNYVALSYVWGTPPPSRILSLNPAFSRRHDGIRARKANIQSLHNDGSLDNDNMPKTIRQAMTLVRDLGETYLWVDCLCIIQDDATDLAIQIPQMDRIYANAAFTIVVANGTSSESGLSRYREPVEPRPMGQFQVTENLSFVSRFHRSSHQSVFQDSPWMQRGWTFQEYLLSKKKIFFLKDRVYWQCENDFWDEGVVSEPRLSLTATKVGTGLDEWPLGLLRFEPDINKTLVTHKYSTHTPVTRIISKYKERNFNPAHKYDVANALLGVFRRISSLGGDKFHWGLSQSNIESSLLWRELSPASQRLRCKLPMHNRLGDTWYIELPSWSWMAWPGSYDASSPEDQIFGKSRSDGLRDSSLEWFQVDINNHLAALERPLDPGLGLELPLPPWRTLDSLALSGSQPFNRYFKDSGRIRTITSFAKLTFRTRRAIHVVSSYGYYGPDIWEYDILSIQGKDIGRLYGLCGDYQPKPKSHKRTAIFIVIRESPRSLKELRRTDWSDWTPSHDDLWYLLHVMLVEWDSKRQIAYRRGMFAISEADWMRAGPKSKIVTLG